MTATIRRCLRSTLVALLWVNVISPDLSAAIFVIADSEGFEEPLNSINFLTTGQLEGQFARTTGGFSTEQWSAAGVSDSTAFVQDAVAYTGTQAVKLDRAPNEFPRWGVPVDNSPLLPYVYIEWDMMIPTQPVTSVGYGPVFGVDAYDDASGFGQLSFLGVDIATQEILYQEEDTGFYVPVGNPIAYDTWYSFKVILDFTADEYLFYVDDQYLGKTGFIDRALNLDQFSDADLAALAGDGDPLSLSLTGTAYFDNYIVYEADFIVPEPGTGILLAVSLLSCLARASR
jgi:hypothetical protein